jgi:chromosome segregation ATPase
MSSTGELTVEILRQIRSDLHDGLGSLREEVGSLRGEVVKTNEQLNNLREMQDVLAGEIRKTNQRLDFFAQELVRMRTRDSERITALETAVAALQQKVG